MSPSYRYSATVVSIHDGDTMTVSIDCGFRMTYTTPIRFYGIDAPELSTPEGKVARDYLKRKVKVGDQVVIETFKNPEDKYGRWLANIYTTKAKPVCLNELMVKHKHATEYFGGKKETIS